MRFYRVSYGKPLPGKARSVLVTATKHLHSNAYACVKPHTCTGAPGPDQGGTYNSMTALTLPSAPDVALRAERTDFSVGISSSQALDEAVVPSVGSCLG